MPLRKPRAETWVDILFQDFERGVDMRIHVDHLVTIFHGVLLCWTNRRVVCSPRFPVIVGSCPVQLRRIPMENTLALYHTLVAERGQQTNAVLIATICPWGALVASFATV